MYDRGYLVGYIQLGRINGSTGLRGLSSQDEVLGYASSLEEASERMWEWYRRTGRVVAGSETSGLLGHASAAEDEPQDGAEHR